MKGRYISDFSGRSNNLAFIKFLAALLVIYSHSYSLSGSGWDPLDTISKGEISFGGFAVGIFFFASGFYVTKSIIKKSSSKEYIFGRISRIYPTFFVTIILTAFVLGPIVSTLSIGEYFSSKETYAYILYLVMIPRYSLPGVFKDNPMYIVNGSMWTLILETVCYVMLFVLWKSKMLEKKSMIRVMMLLTVVFSIVGFGIKLDVIYQFHAYLRPLVIFVVGMFYYLYEDKIPLDFRLLVIAVIGLIVCVIAGVSDFGMVTFFPYILSFIMFMKHQVSESFAKTGELSYVMYLVAFPIQQTIVRYAGDISVCLLFVSASVICIMVSILGYNCVEKPAGKWIMDRVRKV